MNFLLKLPSAVRRSKLANTPNLKLMLAVKPVILNKMVVIKIQI